MSFAAATIPAKKDEFFSTTKHIPLRPKNTLYENEEWSWKRFPKYKALTERSDYEVRTAKSLPFRTDRRRHPLAGRKGVSSARRPGPQASPEADIWITSKLKYYEQKNIQEACTNRIKELEAQLTEMLHYYKMLYDENAELKQKLNITDSPVIEHFDVILKDRGILRNAEQNYKRRVTQLEQESRDAAIMQGKLLSERKRIKSKVPDPGKELEKEAMYHRLYWECNTQRLRNESLKKQIVGLQRHMNLKLDLNRSQVIGRLKSIDQVEAENMLIDIYKSDTGEFEPISQTVTHFKSRSNRFILELQSKINATSLDIETHAKDMQRLKTQYDKLVDNTLNGHVSKIRCDRLVRRLRDDLTKLKALTKLPRIPQNKCA